MVACKSAGPLVRGNRPARSDLSSAGEVQLARQEGFGPHPEVKPVSARPFCQCGQLRDRRHRQKARRSRCRASMIFSAFDARAVSSSGWPFCVEERLADTDFFAPCLLLRLSAESAVGSQVPNHPRAQPSRRPQVPLFAAPVCRSSGFPAPGCRGVARTRVRYRSRYQF